MDIVIYLRVGVFYETPNPISTHFTTILPLYL